jgi:hypothetical protein
MLGAMGNLAERYRDAARSGLYRVNDAGIPRTAALEADALLIEVAACDLAEAWTRIVQRLDGESTRACVLLVPGAAALACEDGRGMLQAVSAQALAARATGRAFFAVMVDAEARLDLPGLYREKVGG